VQEFKFKPNTTIRAQKIIVFFILKDLKFDKMVPVRIIRKVVAWPRIVHVCAVWREAGSARQLLKEASRSQKWVAVLCPMDRKPIFVLKPTNF
jgi:hypothetical protein